MSDNIKYDMATAIKMISPFSGNASQDINIWLRNFRLYTNVYGCPQSDLGRILLCCLQGEALTWASAYLSKVNVLDFESISTALETRFSSRKNVNQIIRKIVQSPVPKSSSELSKMFEDANYLYERRYMDSKDIADLIIDQLPEILKLILWNIKSQYQEWPEMAKAVLDASELILDGRKPENPPVTLESIDDDKMEVCRINKLPSKKSNETKKSFSCSFHRENTSHDSKDCRTLKTLKEQGWAKKEDIGDTLTPRKVSDNSSKYSSLYTLNILCRMPKNPFFTTAKIGSQTVETLIDTGADINIINKSMVPDNIKIAKTKLQAKTACGSELRIVGKSINIPIEIGNKRFLIDAYVVDKSPTYTILGYEFILKNQEVIRMILEKAVPKNCKNVAIISAKDSLSQVIKEYDSVFQNEISTETLCTMSQHRIDTGNSKPICQRNFRVPINFEKDIDEEVNKLLHHGVIQPSSSEWCSRIVPITKKDGKLRMCIDFRELNKVTVRDSYPMPRIDEILDKLAGATIFSTLDATSGFHQIALDPKDRHKTAFAWKGGLYEYTRMPFGLCNAPATFQRAMDKIFRKERDSHIIPYFDDIIIFSKSYDEHLRHLDQALSKIKAAGLSLNKSKCNVGKEEIKILGFVIKKGIVRPDPEKIRTISEFQKPHTVKEMRSFLGTANVFRDFLPHIAHITKPLNDMLKGTNKASNKILQWNSESIGAFKEVKVEMSKSLERAQPDFKKSFILTTDASDKAIGGILSQMSSDGKELMIRAYSKTLDKAQTNYSVTDKELLAVVKSLEHFRHYLIGRKFILKTDHKALEHLWSSKNLSSRMMRYSLKLQDYDFTPIYIKGEHNPADFLSRPIIASVLTNEPSTEERKEILKCYHEGLGHGSVSNMEFSIGSKYKWKNIHEDIENYVKNCITCTKGSRENINTLHRAIRTTSPNEMWEIDIIGYLNATKRKNKFILVAIDHYTKWVETKELKSKDKISVNNAIKEMIIDKHGAPQKIYSDNGLEFNNETIKNLCKNYGIEMIFNSPGHHNSIGAVERVNQTVFNKLKKLCNFGEDNWDIHLKQATLATNISFNRSINTSPYILKYGMLPNFEIDKKFNKIDIAKDRPKIITARDEHFQKYAEKHIIKGKISAKNDYKIGENVLVFRKQLGDKLKSDWLEGFMIIEKITPDAYIVSNGKTKIRANKVHMKRAASI